MAARCATCKAMVRDFFAMKAIMLSVEELVMRLAGNKLGVFMGYSD